MNNNETTLDSETRQLAAMAYGEASTKDVPEEMQALASVLVRQRDARGYRDIMTFADKEKSFSFVVSDGNVRYRKLMSASEKAIAKDAGMSTAVAAAKIALAGGSDMSNGAFFWDGADIKSNYKNHAKVKEGVHFSDPAHNIYSIEESRRLVIKTKTITKKKKGKIISQETIEVGRYDYVYISTAAYGGTIFWKFNPVYVTLNHAKEYK